MWFSMMEERLVLLPAVGVALYSIQALRVS